MPSGTNSGVLKKFCFSVGKTSLKVSFEFSRMSFWLWRGVEVAAERCYNLLLQFFHACVRSARRRSGGALKKASTLSCVFLNSSSSSFFSASVRSSSLPQSISVSWNTGAYTSSVERSPVRLDDCTFERPSLLSSLCGGFGGEAFSPAASLPVLFSASPCGTPLASGKGGDAGFPFGGATFVGGPAFGGSGGGGFLGANGRAGGFLSPSQAAALECTL